MSWGGVHDEVVLSHSGLVHRILNDAIGDWHSVALVSKILRQCYG